MNKEEKYKFIDDLFRSFSWYAGFDDGRNDKNLTTWLEYRSNKHHIRVQFIFGTDLLLFMDDQDMIDSIGLGDLQQLKERIVDYLKKWERGIGVKDGSSNVCAVEI